jgi:hypothetical protein
MKHRNPSLIADFVFVFTFAIRGIQFYVWVVFNLCTHEKENQWFPQQEIHVYRGAGP